MKQFWNCSHEKEVFLKTVVQRVKSASVTIDEELYSSIGKGMLILFGVEKGDTEEMVDWMANKVSVLRFFDDENGKMNNSIKDVEGEVLVVSQFTLAADCKKGTRPGFDNAEEPKRADLLYKMFVDKLKLMDLSVKTGVFGAMMDVSLCNDGPVTFVLSK